MEVIIMKVEDNFVGRYNPIKRGKSCLVKCNWCGKIRRIGLSQVLKGAGKFCSKKCHINYQKTLRLDKNYNWKGGLAKFSGVMYVKQPDGGYKILCRVLMEKCLGRKLRANEYIYRRDGDIKNDTLENLYIVSRQKHIRNMISKQKTKPTRLEREFLGYCNENGLPYKYIGNGKLWISDKKMRVNPDFINIRQPHVFIELYGCYWHGCKKCYPSLKVCGRQQYIYGIVKRDKKKRLLFRKKELVLIEIWEHEIKNKSFVKLLKDSGYGEKK